MPGFDAIIDQDRPIRILRAYLQHGTTPHALLFTGPEGVGKRSTALAFAMALNCGAAADRPCGECRACRRIAGRRHPDIHHLAPAGAMIRIDAVRELCRQLVLRPYEAAVRVGIIAQAEALNPAAANALLKMLEEPPPRTVLILTAGDARRLLPTIVSRCQQIRFAPIARRHLAAILERAYGFAGGEAQAAARLAEGSVTRALDLRENRRLARRDWLAAELSPRRPKPAAWALMLAERLGRDAAAAAADLELIADWLRDLALAPLDADRVERPAEILADAAAFPADFPFRAFDLLTEARRLLEARANPRLTLEAFLIKMQALHAGAGEPPAAGDPPTTKLASW